MNFIKKYVIFILFTLSLIIIIESILILFLLKTSFINNTDIYPDSVKPILDPTEEIAITSPTPVPTKIISENPVLEKITKSLVSNLAFNDFCKNLEIKADIPSNTIFTSGQPSADACLNVTLSNSDFQLTYAVYEGGVGCLDTTNVIKIGEIKSNRLPIYRFTRPDPSGNGNITTYHTKYQPAEKGCPGTTNFALLKDYGNIAITCDKNVDICDSIVKSISANTQIIDSSI